MRLFRTEMPTFCRANSACAVQKFCKMDAAANKMAYLYMVLFSTHPAASGVVPYILANLAHSMPPTISRKSNGPANKDACAIPKSTPVHTKVTLCRTRSDRTRFGFGLVFSFAQSSSNLSVSCVV